MSEKRSGTGLLSRLAKPLARLVGGKDQPPAPAPRKKTQAGALNTPLADEAFSLALDQMLSQEEGRSQTKLQIISLVEFREAVGEKWTRVSDKVMLIAEGVVNLHLGSGNLAGRKGTDFFILLFRTCPPAEGKRRAQVIAQELGTRLLGDQFVGGERPQALAAELSLEDALNPDGSINLDAVETAVGTMRSLIRQDQADAGQPLPSWMRTTPKGPEKKTTLPPIAAPRPDAVKAPIQDPGWQEMNKAAAPKVNEPQWQTVETNRSAALRSQDLPAGPALPSHAKLSLVWRPTWMSDETIGAYAARLCRDDQTGAAALESSLAYPAHDARSAIFLDRFVVGGVARDMRRSEDAGNRSTIVLPLHWSSLAAPDLGDIILPLADLTPDVRQNRLVVEIFGAPTDIKPPVMRAAISQAQAFCRQVMLRTSLAAPRAAMAFDCGASLISLDLAELAPHERMDDLQMIGALRDYLNNAQRAGLNAALWGVRRRGLLVGAVQMGFALVNGPALMRDIAAPARVLPAPKAKFTA